MLERYEPSGRGITFVGAEGANAELIGDHLPERAVMRRIFVGICATWGVDQYDPMSASDDLVFATIVLALSGKFWVGQQFEAMVMSFKLTNVSRGFTHQMVRARFMAFGQEGTRDTNQENFDVSVPETILREPTLLAQWDRLIQDQRDFVAEAHKLGIPFQDASYMTPKALLTDIVCHTNLRALQEMLGARLSNSMHWEITAVARKMLIAMSRVYPTFALFSGPRCEFTGVCQSNGTLFPPCGKYPLRKDQSAQTNRFGVPYMHRSSYNPSAKPSKVSDERESEAARRAERQTLVEYAERVFKEGPISNQARTAEPI